MLTYKKALNLVTNVTVTVSLKYDKTVDFKSAMSRRQGSRHPELWFVTFNIDESKCVNLPLSRYMALGGELEFECVGIDENEPIVQAIKMLTPEILENYFGDESADEVIE